MGLPTDPCPSWSFAVVQSAIAVADREPVAQRQYQHRLGPVCATATQCFRQLPSAPPYRRAVGQCPHDLVDRLAVSPRHRGGVMADARTTVVVEPGHTAENS